MGRRTGRSDTPKDPAATVRAMRSCREAMIEVCRCVKPRGPAYHGASTVISAIDAMATLLTGRGTTFRRSMQDSQASNDMDAGPV